MRKELMFQNTGNPAFAVILENTLSIADTSDSIGFYANREGKNYNCGTHQMMLPNSIITGFGDDGTTPTKENFNYGEEMKIWYYDLQQDKFFNVVPGLILLNQVNPVEKMVFAPMSLYYITGATLGEEITLEIDPELTTVVLTAFDYTEPILTGSSEAVILRYEAKNVSNVSFFVALGNGTVKDGLYFYSPTDKNVIINLVASDLFTGEILTSQIKFTLDQNISSNAVFEDDAVLFYPQLSKLILKAKKQIVFQLFRNDAGIWRRISSGPMKANAEKIIIPGNYQRSWIGAEVRIEYTIWEGNKKITPIPIVKTFILK